MRFAATSIFLCALSSALAQDLAGRWEGAIQIPDRPFNLIVDLDRPDGKAWAGSIIIPGLDVKGAPLADLSAHGPAISFAIKGALANERIGQAKFEGQLKNDGELRGNFLQAGNSAPFVLRKTGPAQVELPRTSTAVSQELAGEWKGDFQMLGYPRHVTLTLDNHSGAAATAKFVIVGKRTTDAPVSLLMDENGYLTVESSQFGLGYEGRLRKNELRGVFHLGVRELPLVLQRTAPAP